MTEGGLIRHGWRRREVFLAPTAVLIPAAFGFLWLTSPAYVFLSGTAMAAVSLVLALMVPRDPEPGNESMIFRVMPKPQPAE